MGEIIVRKLKGMNWMAKISLVLIFTLVFSTFMYQGWYKPMSVAADVTAATFPGTGASVTGTGTQAWTTPGNITADDIAYATAILAASETSNYVQGTNYGFSIPAGATIQGIEVSIMRMSSANTGGSSINDTVVSLIKGGTITGSNYAVVTDWPIAMTAATYGGASDLWGTTWTPADINAANFGAALAAVNQSGFANRTASVDYMTITVTYCNDPDPSTITIPASQTANGSPYNAALLKSSTGDVGSFEYKVSTTTTAPASNTFTATGSWTAPAGVTSVTVECWGGGGGGGGADPGWGGNTGAAGGGKGGQYVIKSNIPVTPGNNYTVTIGAGGTAGSTTGGNGGAGGDSWFSTAATVIGQGGNGGTGCTTDGCNGAGGTAYNGTGIGDTVYDGGNGAAGSGGGVNSGGGGGGAGSTGAGGPATGMTAGTGTAIGGGNGGAGRSTNGAGAVGSVYGGGGSGARDNNNTGYAGGAGAAGRCIVTYNAVTVTTCTNWTSNASIPTTTAGGSTCGDYTDGGTYTLDVRGTDPDCATTVTTTPTNFTWNACVETATVAVDEPIASPISLPTSISAMLGGSGGSNAEVSDDNATWHASPWTYTPPGPNQSGTVTFYARATGSCGTINDPTPVTVNYDTTNPTVQSTTPSNGATGIALNSAVTINWSENIDCTTVNTTNITISPTVGWTRTSCSGSQAVFAPSGQANGTAYTVTVGTGVKDLLGTNMASSYPFTYTTIALAPTVGSTSPNSGAQDTSLTVQVSGTNFQNGATVAFSGAGISVTNTTFVSALRIDVTITISAAAATGARNVTVMNPDLQSATLTNGFTVTPGSCVRNVPTVSLGSNGSAAPGSSMVYTLSATNADNSFCGNSTFTFGISSETGNTGSFTLPSVFGSTTTGPLAPGANYNTTFTVTAQGGATVGHTLTSNVSATDGVNHAGQPGSGSVVTFVINPWANNSLLHNSINMTANGSPKNYWSGQGGWGITGGVYGGFMCDTCHTRSTTNIGRVKQTITVPDTSKGNIPGSAVNFQSKSGTTNGFGDDQATHATSTRICEVCHSQPAIHKYNQSGSTLHENTATTPANYQDCIQCHEHKKAFALPGCIDCHAKQQGNRAAVVGQFSGNSHHIQGVALSNTLCYQCHWEANANGSINYTYHLGWRNGQPATSNAAVDLVVWNATTRPAAYTVGTTAVQYNIVAGAAWRTTELPKINSHCIGCHNTPNDAIQPFGDGKTPKQYAWDGTSVGARYTQAGTATWGKYTTSTNAAQKNATKAFSAHGNAANNARGWNTTNGYDGAMVNTSGGGQVLCFDCHNSHGSSVAGTTSSYASATTNGAILKDTTTGIGGYAVTYKPQAGGTVVDKNVRNSGASICFDCHMTQVSGITPWGWQETFGATQAIVGYMEKPYWYGAAGVNAAGAQQRYAYKNKIGSSGGHFGASSALGTSPMGTIGGLCTPCHDPHGVSPTDVGTCSNTAYYTKSTCTTNGGTWTANATTQAYGVPLLKGTWMTSPYKEDAAPANTTEARGGGRNDNPINVGSTPVYRIDQNTFPAAALPATTPWTWNWAEATKMSQADTQFGGLCLSCHAKADINPTTGASAWQGVDRIHNTVKGWGGAGANAGNAIHAFSCSKCHTPHNSCLPRLMITNCLDSSHRGRVGQNGTVRTGTNTYTGRQVGSAGAGIGKFPSGGGGYGSGSEPRGWGSNGGAYFFGIVGTSKSTPPALRACHDGSNTTWPNEKWNTKTPWTAP